MAIPLGERPGAGRVSRGIVPTIMGLAGPPEVGFAAVGIFVAAGDGLAPLPVVSVGGAIVGMLIVGRAKVALTSIVGNDILLGGVDVDVLVHPAKRVSEIKISKAVSTRHKAG